MYMSVSCHKKVIYGFLNIMNSTVIVIYNVHEITGEEMDIMYEVEVFNLRKQGVLSIIVYWKGTASKYAQYMYVHVIYSKVSTIMTELLWCKHLERRIWIVRPHWVDRNLISNSLSAFCVSSYNCTACRSFHLVYGEHCNECIIRFRSTQHGPTLISFVPCRCLWYPLMVQLALPLLVDHRYMCKPS